MHRMKSITWPGAMRSYRLPARRSTSARAMASQVSSLPGQQPPQHGTDHHGDQRNQPTLPATAISEEAEGASRDRRSTEVIRDHHDLWVFFFFFRASEWYLLTWSMIAYQRLSTSQTSKHLAVLGIVTNLAFTMMLSTQRPRAFRVLPGFTPTSSRQCQQQAFREGRLHHLELPGPVPRYGICRGLGERCQARSGGDQHEAFVASLARSAVRPSSANRVTSACRLPPTALAALDSLVHRNLDGP